MKSIFIGILMSLFCIVSVNAQQRKNSAYQDSIKRVHQDAFARIKANGIFVIRPMVVTRDYPEKWKHLVPGGEFMDLFEPMPAIGKLRDDVWGGKNVLPRYTGNGLEDSKYSYWGGQVLKGKDDKYHMITCRWPESTPEGHMGYPVSRTVHAISDNIYGPYKVTQDLVERT